MHCLSTNFFFVFAHISAPCLKYNLSETIYLFQVKGNSAHENLSGSEYFFYNNSYKRKHLAIQEHPVVVPQLSHFWHVPLRISVKWPHSGQGSPVYPWNRAFWLALGGVAMLPDVPDFCPAFWMSVRHGRDHPSRDRKYRARERCNRGWN